MREMQTLHPQPDFVREGFCFGQINTSEKDGKLIPSQSAGHILNTHTILKQRRYFDEDEVAGAMSERIIDHFKIIQIHVDERALSLSPSGFHRFLQRFEKCRSTEQGGERVVGCEVSESLSFLVQIAFKR